ncbi:FAD-binding oxidoreductase [Variovorax sp. 160MFSha2.1]|uniref:FAD-binding oxidoreductase n=1 Tax=Variovorax sp. 160MFSha2.1 TaxID=3158367 RepID=UPI003AAE874F
MNNDFPARLVDLLGASAVRVGDAVPLHHATDWSGMAPVKPLALVMPSSTEEVAGVLRLCQRFRTPVVPQGGLTGLAGGARPVGNGIALSLVRMNAIGPIDKQESCVEVQAGATLQAVQEAAQAEKLSFGIDLGARGSCQIGGNLSTNAGGMGVIQSGMMREQMLGLEVVMADGRILNMLRPMLKNNTGYDLKQLFVGAEGTLGVITRALLKLRPEVRSRTTAFLALPDYNSAIVSLRRLQTSFPGAVAAFELMWEDFHRLAIAWNAMAPPFSERYPLFALIDIDGPEDASTTAQLESVLASLMETGAVADAVIAQTSAQSRALWRGREIPAEFHSRMHPISFDISLPVSKLGDFAQSCVAAMSQRWPGHRTVRFGHLGDGNLHLTTDARSIDAPPEEAERMVEHFVFDLVAQMGGSVSAEHGIGLLKKPYLRFSRTESEIAAMRSVKAAFDPLNLLNPGKIFDLS